MKYASSEHNISLKSKFILFLLLFILPSPVHGSATTHHNNSYGDTLIIGEFVKPSPINPILTHSTISAVLKEIVFEGLIKVNQQMEPEPNLALSWNSSENGLVWKFCLRENVRFHNGIDLTAEDVKFTFDKINDPSVKSPYISIFKNIKTVTVKDKYSLEINLETPLPSLPFYLDVGILPKHLLLEKDLRKAEFNYHPIGTGPFKMGSWSKDKIILKANEAYFEGEPYLNKVIVKFFKDQRTVWAELMKGNVDCVFPTYLKNYEIVEKIPDFKVYSFLHPYCYIFAFNENKKCFTQREVRKALNYSIDKKKIVAKVLRGKGRVSSGTIYPLSWAYDSDISPYPYSPKEALKLLNEAGWQDTNGNHILDKDGKEFEFVLLIVEGDDISRECALMIQQHLVDLGIRMKVKSLSFPIMYEKFLSTKKFDTCLLNIISNDPDNNYFWWHSSEIDHGFNVFSYKSKKVDELLEKGRITLDREERKEIYHQFQREIHDDPPGVFLFWRDYMVGIHRRFRGVRIGPARILSIINEWYVPKEEQKQR